MKLGDISPVAGLLSGKGMFGKLAESGLGGVIPTILAQKRRDKEKDAEDKKREEELAKGKVDTTKPQPIMGAKKGGSVKKMASGGSVKSSASKRADGCAVKGKTKGRMI